MKRFAMPHRPYPLRELPRFRELASIVEARAQLVIAAVREARLVR